jgi:hypothetical protein
VALRHAARPDIDTEVVTARFEEALRGLLETHR